MFKVATLAGVHTAKAKVAEGTDDEKMDLALSLGLPNLTGIPPAQKAEHDDPVDPGAQGQTGLASRLAQGLGGGTLGVLGGAAAGGALGEALNKVLARRARIDGLPLFLYGVGGAAGGLAGLGAGAGPVADYLAEDTLGKGTARGALMGAGLTIPALVAAGMAPGRLPGRSLEALLAAPTLLGAGGGALHHYLKDRGE